MYADKFGYDVDDEPDGDEPEDTGPRPVRVEILQTSYANWVTFQDAMDVEYELKGRTFRNPSPSSLKRLAHLSRSKYMSMRFDGEMLIPVIHRQEL